MSLRRSLTGCALAAVLAFYPASVSAYTVAAPPSIADRITDALSDGSLGPNDLVDAAVGEFWIAVGNAVADADLCRQANEALTASSSPARGEHKDKTATFTVPVTVTGIDPERSYNQTMRATTYNEYNSQIIVVSVVKPDGSLGRTIECGRGQGFSAEGPLDSLEESSGGGARSFAFQTEYGRIIAYLPDDIRAGDTISGSVYVEPNGDDDATRLGNAARLSGYGLEVGDTQVRVAEGAIRFAVAAAGALAPVALSNGGTILAAASVEIGAAAPQPSAAAIPPVSEAGRPLQIPGPFDGDLGTTRVTMADRPVEVLAESPRQVVVMCPPTPGPGIVQVNDGGRVFAGPSNNISIALSAPRTTLRRGERTTLTVGVQGLQGLSVPIAVALQASSSVALQGGNTQTLSIAPRDANPAGEYERRLQLRVVSPGPFDVSARLATP